MLLEKTSSVNMEEHFDEYEHYNFQFDKQIFSGENCQNFEKIVLSKVELSNFRIKRTLALLTKHFSQIVVKNGKRGSRSVASRSRLIGFKSTKGNPPAYKIVWPTSWLEFSFVV